MKKKIFIIISLIGLVLFRAQAQERTVENRPYTDLRTFHFGVLVGTHLQDLELVNMGHQTYINEEGQSRIMRHRRSRQMGCRIHRRRTG